MGLPWKSRERDWLSVFVGQSEVGSFLIDVHDQVSIPQNGLAPQSRAGRGCWRRRWWCFRFAAGRHNTGCRSRSGRLRGRVAVLETFKNGSRRLIPVTFFYENALLRRGLVPCDSGAVHVVFGDGVRGAAVWQAAGNVHGAERDAEQLRRSGSAMDASRSFRTRRRWRKSARRVRWWWKIRRGRCCIAAREARAITRLRIPQPRASAPEADDDPDRPKLHRREGSDSTPAERQCAGSGGGPGFGVCTGSDSGFCANPSGAEREPDSSQPAGRKLRAGPESAEAASQRRFERRGKSSTPATTGSAARGASSQPATPSPGQSPSQPASQSPA